MSDRHRTHTVHAGVLRLADELLDRLDPSSRVGFRHAPEIEQNPNDLDLRRGFALGAYAGWIVLSFACGLLMAVVAVPIKLLIGTSEGDFVLALCLAGSMFCVTGAFNVLWRTYWYLPQARRKARKDGINSYVFRRAMRRSLPRNTSLIFQSAAAVITLIATL